jgi:hypothetical protein
VGGEHGIDGGWKRSHLWDIEDVDSVYRLVSDFTGKNTNRQSNDFLTFAPSARLVLEMRNNEQNAGSRGQEANTAFACGRFLADHRERSQSDSIDSIEIGNPLPDETAITMRQSTAIRHCEAQA